MHPEMARYHDITYPEPYVSPNEDDEYERWLDERERDLLWEKAFEAGVSLDIHE